MKRAWWTLVLALGCGDTGQEHVQLTLLARGTPAQPVRPLGGEAQVTLTRADVSFGPLYVCPSELGRAELCEVALAEFRGTAGIRALEPGEQPLGTLEAVTGNARSAIYDYGISWLLTQTVPRANPGAVEGHSALLEGTVLRGTRSLRFQATLDLAPRLRGDLTVNGQSTRFTIREDSSSLTVVADPNAWVSNLDVDALFALDVDGDGRVEIPPESSEYDSILQGMLSRAPLRFEWR